MGRARGNGGPGAFGAAAAVDRCRARGDRMVARGPRRDRVWRRPGIVYRRAHRLRRRARIGAGRRSAAGRRAHAGSARACRVANPRRGAGVRMSRCADARGLCGRLRARRRPLGDTARARGDGAGRGRASGRPGPWFAAGDGFLAYPELVPRTSRGFACGRRGPGRARHCRTGIAAPDGRRSRRRCARTAALRAASRGADDRRTASRTTR